MNLVYSGSFQALCKTDNGDRPRLSIGLNPEVFSWKLEPGESFQSPEAILVFSDRGLNGMSQAFHSLYRTRLVRGHWRDRSRPVLINNWEGTYFSFTEKRLLAIAEKAKEIGIELFVLDDGWFGRRNSDNCSLGDWTVNRRKLPSGLSGLSDRIHAMGLQFGLWFEPEMVSPDSRLYRAHPDWCLHVPGRQRTEARNQLILDLSRTEVQDYIISSVSSVLASARIDYVKWDMNRNMTEAFSEALPSDRRPETQYRYMLGLYRVLEKITSSFPDILAYWRKSRLHSRISFLNPVPAAAADLIPACCTTCRKRGPAMIRMLLNGLKSSMERPLSIRLLPWVRMSAPFRTIRPGV